jgi:hypothetical protein
MADEPFSAVALLHLVPFWASIAVLSCGAGAVMYVQPVWLPTTSDPYTDGQWNALGTVAAVFQLLYLLPGHAIDRMGPCDGPARVCAASGVATALGCFVAMLLLM